MTRYIDYWIFYLLDEERLVEISLARPWTPSSARPSESTCSVCASRCLECSINAAVSSVLCSTLAVSLSPEKLEISRAGDPAAWTGLLDRSESICASVRGAFVAFPVSVAMAVRANPLIIDRLESTLLRSSLVLYHISASSLLLAFHS
jgi:hypothetical protein